MIDKSISPRSLPNHSPIAPQFISGILNLCCQTSSLHYRQKTLTLIQIYPFLLLLPLQLMNLQKYFSLKIHQAELAAPTHKTFFFPCGFHRDILDHIPPQKVKRSKLPLSFGSNFYRLTASSSIWKPYPSVSIKSKKFGGGMTPAFTLSILSNTLAAAMENSESVSSSTPSSASYITVFLPVLPIYDEGLLPVTHRTHHCWFLVRRFQSDIQKIGFFAWSRQHRCINIGLVFIGLDLKYWLTNRRGTHWWNKWERD